MQIGDNDWKLLTESNGYCDAEISTTYELNPAYYKKNGEVGGQVHIYIYMLPSEVVRSRPAEAKVTGD